MRSFDLVAVARSLLNIEVNTIVRDCMTGEPMPPIPHALLDIAGDYARELCGLGVQLAAYFVAGAGDPEKLSPGWVRHPTPISNQLIISVETFDRLRWAAKWAAGAADRRAEKLSQAKLALLDRIVNNADAIKEMFKRFDGGFNAQFLNKNRDQLLAMTIRPGSYVVLPDDVILLQKIWDIGMEEIIVQTIVMMTGDITTRVQEGLAGVRSEALFTIHRQSVDVSVARWKALLDALSAIAGTTMSALLGRGR